MISKQIYHSLPYPLRVLGASVYGYYLRGWRYGFDTENRVERAIERESWSPEEWKVWREERLAYVLHRAAHKVPYYRAHWEERRRKGDQSSCERLENWPILEKEDLRQHPEAFIADDCNPSLMFHKTTSGTTGKPVQVWKSRETVKTWYALFEARWRYWSGVSRHDRWANIGGHLVAEVESTNPPFWVWNAGLNQLYMSSYHLSPDLIPAYLEALREYDIKYLWGYSSSLYALARTANRNNEKVPMQVAITNAEPLMDHQRKAISEAFQCPVIETYGQVEGVTAASECERGTMHLWSEVGMLEVVGRNGDPVAQGETGEFVSTGLLNADTPLIRYRLGDRGALGEASCACDRTLPVLKTIEGRTDDVLIMPDGRQVGRLDPVFKSDLPIREAQIIQHTIHEVSIRFVPDPTCREEDMRELVHRLQKRVGPDVDIKLQKVNRIPRTANGKFRSVISNVDKNEVDNITVSMHDARE
jgi:phenylacetate-CoA ligase